MSTHHDAEVLVAPSRPGPIRQRPALGGRVGIRRPEGGGVAESERDEAEWGGRRIVFKLRARRLQHREGKFNACSTIRKKSNDGYCLMGG